MARTHVDLIPLHAKICQQALESDFLNGALTKVELLSAKPPFTSTFHGIRT